jgi:predicted sugar kinase
VSGVDTGVGESSLLYGGIVWVDGQARYIGNITTPSMYGIIAFGIREKLTKEQNSKPHANAELLMSLIAKHKLRPHFKAGNLERLLSEAWNLNSLAFRIEKSSYNFEIYSKFSEIVKEKGGSYAGISSEGPVMFALANNRRVANAIAKAVATKLSEYFSSSRVGSVGNRLSISVRS